MPTTSTTQLGKQIVKQMRIDTKTLANQLVNFVERDGSVAASRSWGQGAGALDPVKAVKDPAGIMPGSRIVGAMQPRLTIGDAPFELKVEFWNTVALNAASTPGGRPPNMPIWEMMNWGSGPFWNTDSGKPLVPRNSQVSSIFGKRTFPLRSRIKGRKRSTPASQNRVGGFVWVEAPGFGDLGQGFYAPLSRAIALEEERGFTIAPFQHFRPTYFIEASASAVLQGLTTFLGVRRT